MSTRIRMRFNPCGDTADLGSPGLFVRACTYVSSLVGLPEQMSEVRVLPRHPGQISSR
jgi:hypothetical protein